MSTREASRSRHQLSESPAPSEPESLPVQRRQDSADGDRSVDKASSQPVSLPAGLGQASEDMRASMPSLSPPDSPRNSTSLDRRVSNYARLSYLDQ